MDTFIYVFVGADNAITNSFGTVPAFPSGPVTNTVGMLLPPLLSASLTPANTIGISWPQSRAGVCVAGQCETGRHQLERGDQPVGVDGRSNAGAGTGHEQPPVLLVDPALAARRSRPPS